MKQRLLSGYKTLCIIFLFLIVSILAFAQQRKISIGLSNSSDSDWLITVMWILITGIVIVFIATILKGFLKKTST